MGTVSHYKKKLQWKELQLCDYYVHPTDRSLETAAETVSRDRLIKVPLGADTEKFFAMGIEKEFDLVTVGRLTPSKQIHQLQKVIHKNHFSWIHAGGIVKKKPYTRWDNLFFLMKLGGVLRKYPKKRSLSGKIVTGYFRHGDMPTVYNRAKIMAHPSLGEGAARAVQEAMACEIPVVVLKDAVPFVDSAFGVAIKNVWEIEPVLTGLLKDNEKRERLGTHGRKWLLQHHSSEKLYGAVEKMHTLEKTQAP